MWGGNWRVSGRSSFQARGDSSLDCKRGCRTVHSRSFTSINHFCRRSTVVHDVSTDFSASAETLASPSSAFLSCCGCGDGECKPDSLSRDHY